MRGSDVAQFVRLNFMTELMNSELMNSTDYFEKMQECSPLFHHCKTSIALILNEMK